MAKVRKPPSEIKVALSVAGVLPVAVTALPPKPDEISPVELKLNTLSLKLPGVMGCPTPQKMDQRVKLISRLSPKLKAAFWPLYQGRAG